MFALIAAFLVSQAAAAETNCPLLTAGVVRKVEAYKAFRAQNQATLASLLSAETSCRDRGAAVSFGVARQAAALTCEAALDASEMNRQVREVGTRCEGIFRKIHQLQESLRLEFAAALQDLDAALEVMKGSELLRRACGREVAYSHTVVQEFVALERAIILVNARSANGESTYGKFTRAAGEMQALSASRAKGCAGTVSTAVAQRPAQGAGRAEPFRVGAPQKNGASDITGTERKAARVAGSP